MKKTRLFSLVQTNEFSLQFDDLSSKTEMSENNSFSAPSLTVLGELADTEAEFNFQAAQLPATRKRIRFVSIISGLAYLGAIYADSIQLSGRDFDVMAAARIFTVLIGLIPILQSFSNKISAVRFGQSMALYMGAVICTEMFEIIVKSGQLEFLAPTITAFIILLFYLYQPPQIWQSVLIGGGGSLAYLMLLTAVTDAAFGEVSNIILIFALANGFGFYFSRQFRVSQRREYLILRELKRRAEIDVLTRVFNRRHLLELGSREFQAAKRYGHPFSILSLDIDFFKKINDSHGHAGGDAVLTAFAARCKSALRETDLFGRIGGEEFLALLPHSSLTQALQTANRLRKITVQNPFFANGTHIPVTVSIGVATISKDTLSLETAINAADAALYTAKRNGRNAVY